MPNDPTFITRKGFKLLDTTPTGAGGQALNDNFTLAGDQFEQVASILDSHADQLENAVPYSYVDNVQENLNEHKTDPDAHTDLFAAKASTSYVDDQVTSLQNQLSSFVTLQNLNDALTDKVDNVVFQGFASNTNDAIAAKADQLALTMHIDDDDAHGLNVVRSNVGNLQTNFGTLVSVVDGKASIASLTSHTSNTSNPHSVTAAQVGAYTTGQTDALLNAKATTASLANYLTLTGGTLTGALSGTTATFSGQLQAGSLKVNATTYQSSGELNCGAGSYSDPLPGVLMDAKFSGNGIAVGGRSFFRNRVIIGSATDDNTNQLQVTGNGVFSGTVTASSFSGSGAGLTGLTSAQVGLGNVLNVASYSKQETDAYATSVTSQLAGKLSLTGGTVTGTTTFGSDLNVSGTFTQSRGDNYNSFQLRNSALNKTWQFSQRPSFDSNPNGFDFYHYDGSGWTTKLQLKTTGEVVVPGAFTVNGAASMNNGLTVNGVTVNGAASMNNGLTVNGDVVLNDTGAFVGNYGPNGMTGMFVRGTDGSEVVSLYYRDSEAMFVDGGQIYMSLDVSMGYAYAGSFSTGYIECYGGAYYAGTVSVDAALYVASNLQAGGAKVNIGTDTSSGGTFGGIWFNTSAPTTSNYGFLFDHTTSGTLLNAVTGGYFQMRVGNDYTNGITFSSSKNLIVGGSHTDSGNAKLDVRGNAVVTGTITGNGSGLTNVPSVRSVTVEAPTASENITLFYCDKQMVITKLAAVVVGGSSPSVTWSIKYASDRSTAGTAVVTAGTTTTSTAGTTVTTLNNNTVPAGSWVWLTTSASSGSPTSLTVTITT